MIIWLKMIFCDSNVVMIHVFEKFVNDSTSKWLKWWRINHRLTSVIDKLIKISFSLIYFFCNDLIDSFMILLQYFDRQFVSHLIFFSLMLIFTKRKNRKIRVKIVENSILSCLSSNLLVKLSYAFKLFSKINLKSRFFFLKI